MPNHRYELHARSFVGPLSAPVRNELQRAGGDDRQALEDLADVLRERGFRVWLFERVEAREGSLFVPGRPERFETLREWHPTYSAEQSTGVAEDK